MMKNIEYIMDLLDWNNNIEKQKRGISIAKSEKDISVFLQPNLPQYNKNVWDNCAIIVSSRTDDELIPHICELLCWIQDLNWPGACCILDRLNDFKDKKCMVPALISCIEMAHETGDEIWESNLGMVHIPE